MKMIKSALLSFSAVFLLAAMPLALAQTPSPGGAGGPVPDAHVEQRIHGIFSQLNLSDDQKKRLEANKQQHRAKMEVYRKELKVLRQSMQEALMKPQLDMSLITATHNQIKVIQDQMEDTKLDSILAVRSILTPEQFTKFVDLMAKHHAQEEHDKPSGPPPGA